MKRIFIAVLGLLVPLAAVAQPVPPPTNLACGRSITACQQVAPRTNILGWLQGTNSDAATATDYTSDASGHTASLAYEMPDDVTAVAVLYGNGSGTAWAVGKATVATSSMYGTSTGQYNYTRAGVQDSTWLPVTFKNGGRASLPWPGAFAGFQGTSVGGRYLLSLNLTSASTNTLTFSSTQTSDLTATLSPVAGMYAWDTLGCIPANATVSSVTTTTVVMSASSSGCVAGQLIAFSWAPPGSLGVVVPASTNAPQPTIVMSDWIPVLSKPRLDHPLVGQTLVGNACLAANTTITGVNNQSIVVNPGIASNCGGLQLSAQTATTTTSDTPNGYQIAVASTTNIQVGQIVTGSANLPSGDIVDAIVDATHIQIHLSLLGDLPSGTTLTLTNKVQMTGVAQTTGQTVLPVIGTTNARPLILVRTLAVGGQPWAHSYPNNASLTENSLYGFPGIISAKSAAGSNLVDFPATSNAGNTNDVNLVWGLLFLTRHNGVQCVINGDSHIEGDTTGSGIANFARRACYQAATASVPVEVFNATRGAQSEQEWQPLLADILQVARPGIVIQLAGTMNGGGGYIDPVQGIDSLRAFGGGNGAKSIIALDYPKGTNTPFSVMLAAPMTNQTTGTLTIYSPGTTSVSGASVTCSGCSAGLTANLTYLSNQITFSAPQTLPTGTLIQFNVIPATTAASSTTLTLATPAPYGVSSLTVTGANIPANDTASCGINSTACTLAVAASASGSTTITFSSIAQTEQTRNNYNALAMNLRGGSSAVTVIDPNSLIDPTSGMTISSPSGGPTGGAVLNPGESWDGVHCNDNCHQIIANALLPYIQRMIGN